MLKEIYKDSRLEQILKTIINSITNCWWKKELAIARKSIQFLEINDAIYVLNDLKKKINPKADAMIKLEEELNIRIKAQFKPIILDSRIKAYHEIANINK